MKRRMFTDERKLAGQYGIFTLARGWTTSSEATKAPADESFEAFLQTVAPGKLRQAEDDSATAKSERAAGSHQHRLPQPKVADLYDQLLAALGRQELTHSTSSAANAGASDRLCK